MKAADMTMERIEQLIAEHRVSTVIVAATDPAGVVRGKRLTVPYFRKAVEGGVNFSSYILGTTTMDEVLPGLFDTGIPDVRGHIDLGSFRLAPWEDGAAIVLMDWHTEEGEPHPLCPRSALKRQVERAGDMGYAVRASLELEFYLLPIPIREVRQGRWSDLPLPARDIHCYSVLEGHFSEPIIGRLRACFPDEIEACLPEWGQGQFEVNLYRSDALKMADTAVMMKLAPSRSRRRPAPPPPSSPSCARTCPAAPAISTSACAMQGAARACSTTPRARSGCRASSCVVAGNLECSRGGAVLCAERQLLQAHAGGQLRRHDAVLGRRQPHRRLPGDQRVRGKARLEIRIGAPTSTPISPSPWASARGCGHSQGPPAAAAATGNNYEQGVETVPATWPRRRPPPRPARRSARSCRRNWWPMR